MLADVPMVFILVGITAYTVLSGADFGAGLWTLIPGGGQADAATTRDHTRHAIGPVWEANHVWLIFVLTVAWTCYPVAFGSIVSTLSIPLFIAAVGIIFRGDHVRAAQPARPRRGPRRPGRGERVRAVVGAHAVRAGHGHRRDRDRAGAGRQRARRPVTSWLNPVSILAGVLAVAFSGYLAAVYLAADARRLAERISGARFPYPRVGHGCRRRRAGAGGPVRRPGAGPPALARAHHRASGWPWCASARWPGVLTLILVWRDRFGLARASAALAVAAVIAGWAAAQEPRLLPGLTVSQAAAGRATLIATIIGVAVGAFVLVPSLTLLYTLVLRGRLEGGPGGEAPTATWGRPWRAGDGRGSCGRGCRRRGCRRRGCRRRGCRGGAAAGGGAAGGAGGGIRGGDPGGRGGLDDLRHTRLGARPRRAAARGLRRHGLRHGRQPARAIMRPGRDRIEIYLS